MQHHGATSACATGCRLTQNSIEFCRLGLGAVAPHPSKFVPSNDPLERKLRYKLDAARRNAAKIAEESTLAAKDDDDDDDEEANRTSAFAKKRPTSLVHEKC
ncbi:hypothetical protein ACFX2I_025952 [Malus domestica]